MRAGASELIEIFSAIQGEGAVIGRRQVFLRFGRCDVTCSYCDTPLCHVALPEARIEGRPGARDFATVPNPVSDEDVFRAVERLATSGPRHHSVSLTGGEPLLHAGAILRLAPRFRELGLLVYLETNGHLTLPMRRVAAVVDIVGMDIKIESATGFPARHDDNRAFLQAAASAGSVFVKIVVDEATSPEELSAAVRVVADVAPETLVVLQPVTPFRGRGVPPSPSGMLALQDAALALVPNAVVIPQTHKMIQQL